MFYTNSTPILLVVTAATFFKSARSLDSMKAEPLRKALRICWIDVYPGLKDVISLDTGNHIMAAAFQSIYYLQNIKTKPIPFETANSISIVEQYYTPLRRTYRIIY